MKKALKVVGWTVLSLLLALIIAVSVLIWVVFTPKRLTPIVQNVAESILTCDNSIGDVELTFFSTFPRFGLKVNELLLLNPKPGSPSDTLLYAPSVVATVDVKEYLDTKDLHLYDILIDDVVANIFVGADGTSNLDILSLESDTTDSTSSELPIRGITVDALRITARDANARIGGVDYAQHLAIRLDAPLRGDLSRMHFVLDDALLAVNAFEVRLAGVVDMPESDIVIDAQLSTNEWNIPALLSLIPDTLLGDMLDGISLDGRLQLEANVKGVYNDALMPLIDAHIRLLDASGTYASLSEYPLDNVRAEADAHIDLNDSTASNVQIQMLEAHTKNTSVCASGSVDHLLGDMYIDMVANIDTRLSDLAYFLPENIKGSAKALGKAEVKMRLDDLVNMRLHKGSISGTIHLSGVDVRMDSMFAKIPKASVVFAIPNKRPARKQLGWLNATIEADAIDASMEGTGAVSLGKSSLGLQTGNILSSDPVLYAQAILRSTSIHAVADSMEAQLVHPDIQAYVEYNTKDTTVMPVVDAQIGLQDIRATYKDIRAHLTESTLTASVSGGRKDKSAPRLKAQIETSSMEAQMDTSIDVSTKHLKIGAAARYNKDGNNILLQWNPKLDIQLENGLALLSQVPMPVLIPSIDFAYSNKICSIRNSKIVLGKSDFSLKGEVRNIGMWLKEEGVLEGEVDFESSFTDINQLMSMLSDDGGSEETEKAKEDSKSPGLADASVESEPNPFIVPRNVDLTLNTNIKKAEVFKEKLQNLQGRVYIKDGILVLEEMGFVCKAAKLQLTAMYKSPRRNDLYVGLDYHMIDVDIEELIRMIPQLDSILPMLNSFRGNAEFHLAAETYLKADYTPKYSTLRGACSLSGKDLTVLDSETFSKISKLLMFNKKTENKVDSISAEVTVYKNDIDVYPFCVSMDNYMVALGGRHNLDMTFNYDVNVLSPLYLGVNVSGSIDDLNIKLAPCKYAKDFRPIFHRKVDSQSAELRAIIRSSMQKNVHIQ